MKAQPVIAKRYRDLCADFAELLLQREDLERRIQEARGKIDLLRAAHPLCEEVVAIELQPDDNADDNHDHSRR